VNNGKPVYVMYTPSVFFYYLELNSLVVSEDKTRITINYNDPHGKYRTIVRRFSFWDKKGAKELYDEVINVNNLNKEKHIKPKGVI